MRAWLATLLLACAACGNAPAERWAGEVVDSAGIALVGNPEAGLWTRQHA